MTLLKAATDAPGYLKAGFLGFAGSGKTFTAAQLAVAVRKHFSLTAPVAFFDTENGSPFVTQYVRRETGTDLLVVKSRSLQDLKATVRECVDGAASVLVVDSITHVWREVCDTYLATLNRARKSGGRSPLDRLEFSHWNYIKSTEMWGGWTDVFLNSPLHVIVCGRAGYDYDFEEDATGKKQLVKTGVKMKVEGEFGFEPSIVTEMTAEQTMNNGEVTGVTHRAFVLKDRTMDPAKSLVGAACDNPTAAFFQPHLDGLRPGQHVPVDTSRTTAMVIDEAGNPEFRKELQQREILVEEILAALDGAGFGGTSAEAKATRPRLLTECFGTASKTAIENMKSDHLREGLAKLRVRLAEIATGGK